MACCKQRPYLCPVLVFGLIAIALQGVAYVAPGWIMLGRELTKFDIKMFDAVTFEEEDIGRPPQATGGPVAMAKRSHGSDMDTTVRPAMTTEDPTMGERVEFEEWFHAAVIDISRVQLRVNYGLWFSTVCVHEKYIGRETIVQEEIAVDKRSVDKDSDSSSEDEDDGKHKKCHCKRISTYCALLYKNLFRDRTDSEFYLSTRHFGHGSLKEHRIENSAALFFLVIGVISAIGAFRKPNRCRYAAITCVVTLLIAAILIIVPVIRLGRFSMAKHNQEVPVYVHPPVSVICAGVSAILAVLTALIASVGATCKTRAERPGNWYQFNNELELPAEKSKPQLVFISEPLPEKPGMEPEQKPLE